MNSIIFYKNFCDKCFEYHMLETTPNGDVCHGEEWDPFQDATGYISRLGDGWKWTPYYNPERAQQLNLDWQILKERE